VTDVAMLLTALVSHQADKCEPQTSPCYSTDYVAGLGRDALKTKRIGVLRFKPGSHPEMDAVYERSLARLRAAGATLVEVQSPDSAPIEAAELKVLLSEFKSGVNAYLAASNAAVRTRDLAQLIEFNRASAFELQLFGQDIFLQAQDAAGLDDAAYRAALEESRRLAGAQGIDQMLEGQRLDLLVAPTTAAAWRVDVVSGDRNADSFTTLAAVAGYPHLSVPMGQVHELPVGLSFIGPAWSEPLLLACGYAFEGASPPIAAPTFIVSLESEPAVSAAFRPLRPAIP
jgi:amidase